MSGSWFSSFDVIVIDIQRSLFFHGIYPFLSSHYCILFKCFGSKIPYATEHFVPDVLQGHRSIPFWKPLIYRINHAVIECTFIALSADRKPRFTVLNHIFLGRCGCGALMFEKINNVIDYTNFSSALNHLCKIYTTTCQFVKHLTLVFEIIPKCPFSFVNGRNGSKEEMDNKPYYSVFIGVTGFTQFDSMLKEMN